jgi:5-methylcytosine-specific restriction endonuclease McrA
MAKITPRFTNEQVIEAYQQTGSVWAAGKKLGMAGQSVHERLQKIGYPMANQKWTDEEYAELKKLKEANLTIAQIASRLGRPYAGVALKISRLGLGDHAGNKGLRKIPRGQGYDKTSLKKYISDIDFYDEKVTTYAKKNGLDIETLAQAIERHFPEWWIDHRRAHSDLPEIPCPHCKNMFIPFTKKQIYCSRRCGELYRVDQNYFGGKRHTTIGLAEKTCQLCGRSNVEGISSHHVIGKENDPDNEYLIALCRGCHQIVTILGGRIFTGEPEVWEALIQLVMLRKKGAPGGVSAYVEIDIFDDFDQIDE